MTAQEFMDASIALRNQWSDACTKTNNAKDLLDLAEQFITDQDNLITTAGGHPEPPPPRVRPH